MDYITDELQQFEQLIAALSARLGIALDGSDGMVVIIDADQTVRMVIELSSTLDKLYLILPLLPFPDSEEALGRMALDTLLLNADRRALGDASLCADAHQARFCLIKDLDITLSPASFLDAVDSCASLAENVGQYLLDQARTAAMNTDEMIERA